MKVYDKEEIWQLILKNKKFAERCMLKIYSKMTLEEKAKGFSLNHDNIGYNRYDTPFMCFVCEKLKSGNELSAREFYMARYRLKKYLKQLVNIANEIEEEKEAIKEVNESPGDTQIGFYGLDNSLYCDYGICSECNMMKCMVCE